MLEPLAVAVYSCRRADVGLGMGVLVLGAGPIGLVALLTARAMGAGHICITGKSLLLSGTIWIYLANLTLMLL